MGHEVPWEVLGPKFKSLLGHFATAQSIIPLPTLCYGPLCNQKAKQNKTIGHICEHYLLAMKSIEPCHQDHKMTKTKEIIVK